MQKGIDVSHWNKLEDLWKYGKQDFLIAKLSEGKSMIDYTAYTYYMYARTFLQEFGVYHFAHPESNSVAQEVNHFLKCYEQFSDKEIKIWLDVEGKALTLNNNDLDNWCNEFLSIVKNHSYKLPGIYISQSQCKRFKKCKQWDLWVARYRDQNLGYGDINPWKEAYMWQYNSDGVDKNIKF